MSSFSPRETFVPALGTGFAAGLVFWLSPSDSCLLLVVMPLLLVGLALGARLMSLACLTCCLTTMLLLGPGDGLSLALFIAFPSLYFVERSLLWRGPEGAKEWFPVLKIFSDFAAAAACLFVLAAMATQADGGLAYVAAKMEAGALEPIIRGMAESKNADPDVLAQMHELEGDLSFLFLAGFVWTMLLMFYGLAVLANMVLKTRSLALRPSLAIEMRGIPATTLMLLGLSAGLAVVGDKTDSYTARTLFLTLLLPYFLAGMSFIHTFSIRRGIPARKVWLTCVYIVLIYTRWLILPVIAIGLYLQLSEILDRRPKIR